MLNLNRTNRTLSANLDRLNLGTRSLAIAAGSFNVAATQRPALDPEPRHRSMCWGFDPMYRPEIRWTSILGTGGTTGSHPHSPGVAVPKFTLGTAHVPVGVVAELPPGRDEVVERDDRTRPSGRRSACLRSRDAQQMKRATRSRQAAAFGRATPTRLVALSAAGG